jgi:hypothetical protein
LATTSLSCALGCTVGDTLRIFADVADVRVAGTTPRRVLVAWPWWEVDEESANSWDGTVGFPGDPDAYEWRNTPWRLEPDPSALGTGDGCLLGVPPTEVRLLSIDRFDPPADFGFLPRPGYALGVCPLDLLDDQDAGYTIYPDSGEPIEIEVVGPG